jgi:hypothetical protein
MKKDGYDVEIVSKHPDYALLIKEKGLSVSGASGN